jgi:hypothetical protein
MTQRTGNEGLVSRVYGYFIASGDSPEELRVRVVHAMSSPGWRPVGGIAVENSIFYQAMLLDEDQETHYAEVEEAQKFLDENPHFRRRHDATTSDGEIYDGQ